MGDKARLTYDDVDLEFPVVVGTEGERGIDIGRLRRDSGLITLDPSFGNTGSCESSITFVDGENGILRYRGYSIEDLCEHSTFIETAYLLLNDRLPTREERRVFRDMLTEEALLHEEMIRFFRHFPPGAHPMNILSTLINAMHSFYPYVDANSQLEDIDHVAAMLLSKVRTIVAFAYRKSTGQPLIYPRPDMPYCANFLNMMFDSPVLPYEIDPLIVRAINMLLIMHADHEQNCSTATVRLVGSSHANLYAAVASGISSLWGPLHGGANQKVMEMLIDIRDDPESSIDSAIKRAKEKDDSYLLFGFGHRVYKNYDPRARIIKDLCREILMRESGADPLLELAMELEDRVLSDSYFQDRRLYPNVDFYSGLLYRAIGFPMDMFTVIFAMGRLPGWISHWKEMVSQDGLRIGRPRQIYTGSPLRKYVPIDER